MVGTLSEYLYGRNKNIRERFAGHFCFEVNKAQLKDEGKGLLFRSVISETVLEESFDYDSVVLKCIENVSGEEDEGLMFESFQYEKPTEQLGVFEECLNTL